MKSSTFILHAIVRLIGFAVLVAVWRWFIIQHFDLSLDLVIIVTGVILVAPISALGRLFLNKYPSVEFTYWINMIIHTSIMLCLGPSIIRAFLTHKDWRGLIIPFPKELGLLLSILSGCFVFLTILNLALKGLGAPFALIISSKYLVNDWLYTRSRNPMVLAIILFLLSLGILFQSLLFLIWVLVLVLPAWTFFLKIYEEKELEIRFGEIYLSYKVRTPMLVPFTLKLL
ncbi:MAG: methyltransferase family protein [Candidatus Hodarchaeales archaeon]